MTSDPVVISASDPLRDALTALLRLDARHLPVVDAGELVGMLSDRDLKNADTPAVEDGDEDSPLDRPVSQFMSGDVISVTPEADVTDVIDLMVENRIGAVPVVDPHDGGVVGIVSYIDVLRAAADLF